MDSSWQDVTLMAMGFMFALFLVPAIRSNHKPPLVSCIATALGMAVVTICVASLGLWLAAIANSLSTATWAILALQRRKLDG